MIITVLKFTCILHYIPYKELNNNANDGKINLYSIIKQISAIKHGEDNKDKIFHSFWLQYDLCSEYMFKKRHYTNTNETRALNKTPLGYIMI